MTELPDIEFRPSVSITKQNISVRYPLTGTNYTPYRAKYERKTTQNFKNLLDIIKQLPTQKKGCSLTIKMVFTTVKEQKVQRNVHRPTFSCKHCTCLGSLLLLQITSK